MTQTETQERIRTMTAKILHEKLKPHIGNMVKVNYNLGDSFSEFHNVMYAGQHKDGDESCNADFLVSKEQFLSGDVVFHGYSCLLSEICYNNNGTYTILTPHFTSRLPHNDDKKRLEELIQMWERRK